MKINIKGVMLKMRKYINVCNTMLKNIEKIFDVNKLFYIASYVSHIIIIYAILFV